MFLLNIINSADLFQAVRRFTALKPVQNRLTTERGFHYEEELNGNHYEIEIDIMPKYSGFLPSGKPIYGDDQKLVLFVKHTKDDDASLMQWDLDKHIAHLEWEAHKHWFSRIPVSNNIDDFDQGEADLSEGGVDSVKRLHAIKSDRDEALTEYVKNLDPKKEGKDAMRFAKELHNTHIRFLDRLSKDMEQRNS